MNNSIRLLSALLLATALTHCSNVKSIIATSQQNLSKPQNENPAHPSTPVSPPTPVLVATPAPSPSVIGNWQPYVYQSLSGMFMDTEPDEGPIPATGRTYRGTIAPHLSEQIISVQFLIGNLSMYNISGAKMAVKLANTPGNTITNNPRTGWVVVTINGRSDLPVAANPDPDLPNGNAAKYNGFAWTDPVSFPGGYFKTTHSTTPKDSDLVWKIFVPARAAGTTYARNWSNYDPGANALALRISMQKYFSKFNQRIHAQQNFDAAKKISLGWSDGDFVSTPSLEASDWHGTDERPDDDLKENYAPPYASATPILAYRWKITRNIPVFELLGDSITQGYNDRNAYLSPTVEGYPGRLTLGLGLGNNPQYSFYNFGQSGFTPKEYLARWKGLARADLSGATAVAYSIYSPNGLFELGYLDHSKFQIMKDNMIAAETAAAQLGRIFIPTFVTGTNMGFIATCSNHTYLTLELLNWAKNRYGNRVLDLHNTIQETVAHACIGASAASLSVCTGDAAPAGGWPVCGLSMKMKNTNILDDFGYTDDATHPNEAGYNRLGEEAVRLLPTIYNNSH